MTKTNSIPKPLRDRTRLANEITRTRELRAERSRAKLTGENRIRALESERIEAYTRKARGDRTGQKDAEEIEQEINATRRSIESLAAEIEGAQRAEDLATQELGQLLASELTTFADEAEQITQDASDAMESLEQMYRAAHVLWTKAALAWAPLRAALYETYKLQNEEAGFYLPNTALMFASNVPSWPLPAPDELFPVKHSPRPPALEPQQEDDDELDEEEDDE